MAAWCISRRFFRPSRFLIELNKICIKPLRWNNASTPEDNRTKTGAGRANYSLGLKTLGSQESLSMDLSSCFLQTNMCHLWETCACSLAMDGAPRTKFCFPPSQSLRLTHRKPRVEICVLPKPRFYHRKPRRGKS